jgi:ATP-dependent Lhr-like helicase
LPTSGSDTRGSAIPSQDEVFAQFHPRVQRLVRDHLGWRRLRAIQVAAAGPVLGGTRDVLIIAGTASGKTEAAWLPLFSRLLIDGTPGLGALCISPLKALIDDQVRRLASYGRELDLRVEGWHGDISSSRKMKTLEAPPSALIITPESLQGLLIRKPVELEQALRTLRYVVVDEVHAFAGTDRGHQLQSLLHQVEVRLGRRVPRIALSATVSEPALVTEFLRPRHGGEATVVRTSTGTGPDLDVRILGFEAKPAQVDRDRVPDEVQQLRARDAAPQERLDIARRIDEGTRGRRALVFAGSRLAVEEMTALLRDGEVTGTRRPERFLAHHGSLSRELRQAAESALHEHDDTTVVCTSTLELGVDLPHLDQVVQVDTCLSVAGLRQRLGRSGRREGTRPTLRVYATEEPSPPRHAFDDRLRADLVQSIASVELIVGHDWVEPTDLAPLGLSTLVHQTLALLADTRGTSAQQAWHLLCGSGPWRRVGTAAYGALLRSLADHGLVRQDARGLLLLDEAGLRLVNRRDFLAVFVTPAEYTLRHDGTDLGTLPVSYPLGIGSCVVLGGRTWQVVDVHGDGWNVDVIPHTRGLPPKFRGSMGQVHRRVREVMREVYESGDIPDYLDETAAGLLAQGRGVYTELGLQDARIAEVEGGSLLALWTGDRELVTVRRWIELRRPGLQVFPADVGLAFPEPAGAVRDLVAELLEEVAPPGELLARGLIGKASAKYDGYVPEDLLVAEYASRYLDVPSARAALERAHLR